MKDANTYEGWSLIKDTCVSWDWTHARLIQCLFQLARDRCCPLSVTTPKDRNNRQIKIVSDLMCLCLPGTELAYFVSAGTFGSNLYCTWGKMLSTLRRLRAWRFTWNWAAWLGLALPHHTWATQTHHTPRHIPLPKKREDCGKKEPLYQ